MRSDKPYQLLTKEEKRYRLREIAGVFLRLGTVAFGGPAAHVSLMEEEVVRKRGWLSRDKFMDLYSLTNLIPGPNSTELAIHLGLERGGLAGLVLAGSLFILPAMAIVLLFAMLYTAYGQLPDMNGILYGIKPVILAIIVQALYRLGKSVLKNAASLALGILAAALSLMGVREIPILLAMGLAVMLAKNRHKLMGKTYSVSFLPLGLLANGLPVAPPMGLSSLFFTFLKIGSVLYGSGYVLIAFLETEFVHRLGVLSVQQLLDAVAVGQFTPGPVFTTATFVGYLIQGLPGALASTLGIFLPSFLLVLLLHSLLPKMRASAWISGALDGVNIASLGFMAAVSVKLGAAAVTDGWTIALFLASFFVLMKVKLNSAWLILSGGIFGWLITTLF